MGDTHGADLIQPKTGQFPAKYSHGTSGRRMMSIILCWASTVHTMQGSTLNHAVVYLGSKLFAAGQAYGALSRVKSLDGLLIEELDCLKLTSKRHCNNDTLHEVNKRRNLFSIN
ncbi:ATP-dependent DNA helicase [Trichonephila clavipes]|nr:ATP-dependent DNA helicase [Trichonephila clavipes]